LADWSAKQHRVQRCGEWAAAHAAQDRALYARGRFGLLDGDKSPAESGENSPHSKVSQLRPDHDWHHRTHLGTAICWSIC